MVFKIKTSIKTMEYFEEIGASENLAPFALSKLAISMSLKSNTPLCEKDFKTDNYGLELNRQTITAEYDQLYKSLIKLSHPCNITSRKSPTKFLIIHNFQIVFFHVLPPFIF